MICIAICPPSTILDLNYRYTQMYVSAGCFSTMIHVREQPRHPLWNYSFQESCSLIYRFDIKIDSFIFLLDAAFWPKISLQRRYAWRGSKSDDLLNKFVTLLFKALKSAGLSRLSHFVRRKMDGTKSCPDIAERRLVSSQDLIPSKPKSGKWPVTKRLS